LKFDLFGKWDPRTLPKISKSEQKHSFTESVAGLVFGTLFGVWWLVGLQHQFLIFGPGIAFVHFGPIWQTVYPLFVVLVVAELVRHVLEVLRPQWEKGYQGLRLVVRALNLIVLYFLLGSSEIIVASDPANPQAQAAMKQLNSLAHSAIIVAAIIAVMHLAWDVYRLLRQRSRNVPRTVVSL
jgi:hypothetical protein